jgi:hypothetical protein
MGGPKYLVDTFKISNGRPKYLVDTFKISNWGAKIFLDGHNCPPKNALRVRTRSRPQLGCFRGIKIQEVWNRPICPKMTHFPNFFILQNSILFQKKRAIFRTIWQKSTWYNKDGMLDFFSTLERDEYWVFFVRNYGKHNAAFIRKNCTVQSAWNWMNEQVEDAIASASHFARGEVILIVIATVNVEGTINDSCTGGSRAGEQNKLKTRSRPPKQIG